MDLHEWSPCQVHGHQFEDDEDVPGRRVCVQAGCDESYDED